MFRCPSVFFKLPTHPSRAEERIGRVTPQGRTHVHSAGAQRVDFLPYSPGVPDGLFFDGGISNSGLPECIAGQGLARG